MKNSILIIDDEQSICESLSFALKQDYHVEYQTDAEEGLACLRAREFDIVLLDLRLGEYNGLDILSAIKEADLSTTVIIMTAYGNENSSLEALKMGAFTYLMKPLNIDTLKIVIAKVLEYMHMTDNVSYLQEEIRRRDWSNQIIGNSEPMRRIYKLINRLKDVDSNVLITGESGTGKELVARAIHYMGKRKNEHFVVVNCAAIPDGLLESELFGYKKGAFTGAVSDHHGKFAVVDNGTIFLDEIGDMPMSLQAKILRVLQNKEIVPVGGSITQKVDVRVVAATNRDLRKMVSEGTFREDLFYRLNVMEVKVPPLRERKEDIIPLCEYFVDRFNKEQKKNIIRITEGAKAKILNYSYPGNVRQLANIIEYAAILTTGDTISTLALPEEIYMGSPDASKTDIGPMMSLVAGKTLKEIEKIAIRAALNESGGKKAEAARALGISERSLWYKIKEYVL